MMKPIVVIPAYKPDQRLNKLVEELIVKNFNLVVVDDGSGEEYNIIFKKVQFLEKVELCRHQENRGKGAALKTGIAWALEKYPETCGVVTADSDGQHKPDDIEKIALELEKNGDQVIMGTRDFSGVQVPFKSRWGNRITSFVYFISSGRKCRDTQTGLRGIPAEMAKVSLEIAGDRYEYEMNFLMEVGKANYRIKEVPIETVYIDENKSSHFHAIKDSARIYFNILKFSLSSLISAAIDNALFALFMLTAFTSSSAGILEATILARVISGCVNFILNKHWVFQSAQQKGKESLQYIILFVSQMFLSWFFVSSFSVYTQHLSILKILVDSSLFVVSYFVQKNLIFAEKRKEIRFH
ncbi:bifunctional glycosyltransferase family 2/GtrA family protein [Eubacteriaceae bacterium ES2]|nr:bifunctional glycosyltransferase family 2/GtrA family protein [Eubacteriaceae bacterium ES2]